MRTCTILACLLGVSLIAPAHAFKINPQDIDPNEIHERHWGWLADIAAPVHEKMTLLALSCAHNASNDSVCRFDQLNGAVDGNDPLIRGARWNDDPNNQLATDNGLHWLFWLSDASSIARTGRSLSPAKTGRQYVIDPTFYLLYRSHFGDLQILHAMAPDGTSPEATRDAILAWAQFAYGVASGEIAPSRRLGSLKEVPAFRAMFVGRKLNWTVRTLFTNVEDKSRPGAPASDDTVRRMALGALLHTIQDSYSNSHTARTVAGTDTAAAHGAVTEFFGYVHQQSKCHGKQDVEPRWLSADIAGADNPVQIGAWLIRAAEGKLPWAEVEPRLRDEVFALAPNAQAAGPGPYVLGGEACPAVASFEQ